MSIGNGDDDFKILLVPWGGASNDHWDDWDLDFKMRMNNMRRVHVMMVRMISLLVLWGAEQ